MQEKSSGRLRVREAPNGHGFVAFDDTVMIASVMRKRVWRLLQDRCGVWAGSTAGEARPIVARFCGGEERVFRHLSTKIGGFGEMASREVCEVLGFPVPAKLEPGQHCPSCTCHRKGKGS